ncbi:helix-turn-helix domain-containing protein [Lentzea sp. PSKA42]|uniref:Helix-turn-helix domain-containing protein n=1 Tax=Lentzea indica TaxID=2604800 RepID=A0ABX1FDY6_9PSEU|nr:helix-turn-helix transcriptional regulator [Lentzea indica]NKE56990.1 helix-turn-helix domain-containing protein [Lentzea indica]
MPKRDSTVRGREFGAGVREALRKAGLTGRRAAELAGWDPAKLSDLLNGKGGITEHDLVRLLGVCRTPIEESEHLLTLFRETQRPGWLQLHGATPPIRLRTLSEHEAATTELTRWSINLIPGQVQLPDYYRATIGTSPNVPNKESDARVAVRAERQAQLLKRRCKMTFFIHEQALRLPVGGPEVMSDQLHHLLDLSVRPYLAFRVVETSLGAHPGLNGSFTFMRFAKHEPVVYTDAESYGLFLDDKESVDAYLKVVKALDRVALDEEQSKGLIAKIAS